MTTRMDLDQVTLSQLRYAVAVEQWGSFRLASARCHVSQSGLSMQVQKLEELLGVVLFDRSKKPVLVTQEGARALSQMREVLRETERLGQVVAEEEEPSGRYRLGVIPTLAPTVLPLFLGDLLQRYPRVNLVIEELQTEDIIARLSADTLDAGLASTPLGVQTLQEHTLAQETMVAYLAAGDPLLKHDSVTQAKLQDRELWVMPEGHCFRSQVLAYCSKSGSLRPPHGIQFESGSFETLIRLVDEGLGATILPALVAKNLPAHKRARTRPLLRPTPVREIGLVTARTQLRQRVTDVLVASIKSHLTAALEPAPRSATVLDPMPAHVD